MSYGTRCTPNQVASSGTRLAIQIFPFSTLAHAALTGNFVHVFPSTPQLGTVILEQPSGPRYLGTQTHLQQYSALFDRLSENALELVNVSLAPEAHSAKDSLALIQHLLYTL
ncbi:Scr1 family TA system antitoxin-like transcriptional regulator [Streptomyces sp. O3]